MNSLLINALTGEVESGLYEARGLPVRRARYVRLIDYFQSNADSLMIGFYARISGKDCRGGSIRARGLRGEG